MNRRPSQPDCIQAATPIFPGLALLLIGLGLLAWKSSPSLFDVFFSTGPSLLLVASGVFVYRSQVPTDQHSRILFWSLVGFGCISVITGVLFLNPATNIDSLSSILAGLGIGAFTGLVAGFHEARATRRGRIAQRQRVDAEDAQAETSQLEHVNHLLRHDISNNLMVIQGHTKMLLDDCDGETRERVKKIQEQSEKMDELLGNVHAYVQSMDSGDALKRKNLSRTISKELEDIEQTYPYVRVDADIPDEVYVQADELLGAVFRNVFRNAVVHNDRDTPELSVSVYQQRTETGISIADNGPGIPEDVRAELFSVPSAGSHGFGLYLVKTLVDRYDGSIAVDSTSESGTTLEIRLPN